MSGANAASLRERALKCMPGGVSSDVRLSVATTFFQRGAGAWLWDADGEDYVDYVLGQGPLILGHSPKPVLRSVERACRSGMVFGAQHPLEVEASERVKQALGWPDLVRFGSSGTEIVQVALRLARAVTRRRSFVRFEGHYHGWLDNVLISVVDGEVVPMSEGQAPESLSECFVLPWNDLGALRELTASHAPQIAAVIMEPVMLNSGAIVPRPGYLEGVRELCTQHKILLIFDEIITGFRLGLGGATEYFGVRPDLATYGKAMAAGWPVAALAGPGELMERLGSTVFHAGTFNGNVMAAAAVLANLEILSTNEPYARIEEAGRNLMAGLSELAKLTSTPLSVRGFPCAFHVAFDDLEELRDFRDTQRFDHHRYQSLVEHLVDAGVWVTTRGIWYVSAAHGEHEVATTLRRVRAALETNRLALPVLRSVRSS